MYVHIYIYIYPKALAMIQQKDSDRYVLLNNLAFRLGVPKPQQKVLGFRARVWGLGIRDRI